MSDRPTPETNEAKREGLLRGNPVPTQVVHVSFAERLEQQRDEARELVRELRDALSVALPHLEYIVFHNESLNGRESPMDRADLRVVQSALIKAKEALP